MLTYIDAGVLLAAVRGTPVTLDDVREVLDDPARTFASSVFVRLEVLPKARYFGRTEEVDAYETYFAAVVRWAAVDAALLDLAEQLAARYGLNGMDALHLAAALQTGADQFVTTERPERPVHRVKELAVIAVRRQ